MAIERSIEMVDRDNEGPVAGWHAFLPRESEQPLASDRVVGFTPHALVRLMSEEGVDVPLWETGVGLVFNEKSEFVEFGASQQLANDLEAWCSDRELNGRDQRSDLTALQLIDRLQGEFDHQYDFVFKP